MNKKRLPLQQLDSKIRAFGPMAKIPMPPSGWIKAIRSALGMSLQQLANRLSITRQGAREMEKREKEGTITLKTLREVARVMDMKLVYGFVPDDSSLEALVERKARELAVKIVARTSATMKLEDQKNSDKRLKAAIAERTDALKQEMPKTLWD